MSVNVGGVRTVADGTKQVTTAIWKRPVNGPVAVRGINVDGDDHGDRAAHGGPDRAVYAYAQEDLDWWATQDAGDVGPGAMGENVTTSGIDVTGALVGEQWRVGTALLEVTSPRIPCFKLSLRQGRSRFQQRFAAANRPGAYLRIVEPGVVGAGDDIDVVHRPDHDVTVRLIADVYHHDHAGAARLLAAQTLTDEWRGWVERQRV